MRRFPHDLSHGRLITMQGGMVMPIGCVEVLPNDDLNHVVASVVRATPQNAPIYQSCQISIESYFVPNRILWDEWELFIAGEEVDPGNPYPAAAFNSGVAGFDRLGDALGVGQVQSLDDDPFAVSLLPFMAYNAIINTYFLDQDLDTPLPVKDAVAADFDIRRCAWPRDRFTTARLEAQKGDAVTIPIGGTAPVLINDVYNDRDGTVGPSNLLVGQGASAMPGALQRPAAGTPAGGGTQDASLRGVADLSSATSVPITDLRFALKLQSQRERRSRWGSRYEDILLSDFGVKSMDMRLQNPEYLGGGRERINWSEVLNTATADSGVVGEMFGHGIGTTRSNRYRYTCQEHGYVITVMYIRPESMYTTVTPRHFFKFQPEDYFFKDFEHVGQQPIMLQEIYPGDNLSPTQVFGYEDRYREYREQPSQASREFLSTLNFWHFGRIFGDTVPQLNSTFIQCVPTNRVFQDTSDSTDKYWVRVKHKMLARRVVSRNAVPGLV